MMNDDDQERENYSVSETIVADSLAEALINKYEESLRAGEEPNIEEYVRRYVEARKNAFRDYLEFTRMLDSICGQSGQECMEILESPSLQKTKAAIWEKLQIELRKKDKT